MDHPAGDTGILNLGVGWWPSCRPVYVVVFVGTGGLTNYGRPWMSLS